MNRERPGSCGGLRVRRDEAPRAVTVVPEDRPVLGDHAGGTQAVRLPWVDVHAVGAIARGREGMEG